MSKDNQHTAKLEKRVKQLEQAVVRQADDLSVARALLAKATRLIKSLKTSVEGFLN